MKVCILGDGLVSLSLANILINNNIFVDIFTNQKIKKQNKNRTIGISKSNIEYFNKNIANIEKFLWNINKIEIYSENLKKEKILDFENDKTRLFSIIKNSDLNNCLLLKLKKSKLIKFKKKIENFETIKKKYQLIIDCDLNNKITKKIFYKKFEKKYFSYAHATIIQHKEITNNTAIQIFTKKGPMAFLPISKKNTSIVYSVKGDRNIRLLDMINKYNLKYKIVKMNKPDCFELKSMSMRFYYHKNILAFGDLLHKLHPLAGQGFNMSIRDINELSKIIKKKISLGLDLDSSIFHEFEKKTKHKNYLFSNGIDLIYEFFNFENRINSQVISKSIKFLNNNKLINKFIIKSADEGIII